MWGGGGGGGGGGGLRLLHDLNEFRLPKIENMAF